MYQTKALFFTQTISLKKVRNFFIIIRDTSHGTVERKGFLFVFKVKYKRLMLQFQIIILHLEIVMLKFQQVFLNSQKRLKAEKYLTLNLKNLQMIMKVKRYPGPIIGEGL